MHPPAPGPLPSYYLCLYRKNNQKRKQKSKIPHQFFLKNPNTPFDLFASINPLTPVKAMNPKIATFMASQRIPHAPLKETLKPKRLIIPHIITAIIPIINKNMEVQAAIPTAIGVPIRRTNSPQIIEPSKKM